MVLANATCVACEEELNWSTYQQAIFDFVEKQRGSAVVIAVAGSGKTTTIVEAAKRIPTGKSCTFVAFNRSIKDELSLRLPKTMECKTLNGLGYSAMLKRCGCRQIKIDTNKTRQICKDMRVPDNYVTPACQLVAKCKAVGLVPSSIPQTFPLVHASQDAYAELVEFYDIELNDKQNLGTLTAWTEQVLSRSILDSCDVIDFDDQIYIPVIYRAAFRQSDFLFVDEAQDVNHIQREMLKMALKPGGRLIAVGDPAQAIYGFRGADVESIENIKKDFNAIELPLTVSYRCPQSIVDRARNFVSHIQASPDAPEGNVYFLDKTLEKVKHTAFDSETVILCRVTAPIIAMAYNLIRAKRSVTVFGREIGQGLIKLIDKLKPTSLDDLSQKLDAWQEKECRKHLTKGNEAAAERCADQADTIRCFIENLEDHGVDRSGVRLDQLKCEIESLFSDNKKIDAIELSTIHKAKGLEWKKVFILDAHKMPSPYARKPWQLQQESNLHYVAITRSKSELYYIRSEQVQ